MPLKAQPDLTMLDKKQCTGATKRVTTHLETRNAKEGLQLMFVYS